MYPFDLSMSFLIYSLIIDGLAEHSFNNSYSFVALINYLYSLQNGYSIPVLGRFSTFFNGGRCYAIFDPPTFNYYTPAFKSDAGVDIVLLCTCTLWLYSPLGGVFWVWEVAILVLLVWWSVWMSALISLSLSLKLWYLTTILDYFIIPYLNLICYLPALSSQSTRTSSDILILELESNGCLHW